MKYIQLCFRYLKEKSKVLILYLIILFVYTIIFYLYNIELEGLLLASTISILLLLFIFIISFIRFLKKYQELQLNKKSIVLLDEELPIARTMIEVCYRDIISTLREENRNIKTQWQMQQNDSIDYYSTWVHQIKAPIATMRLLLQSDDTQQNQELLTELFRIEQYVEMVLSYIRLDTSTNDFIFQMYSLDDIIKTVIRKYAGQFIRKHIALQYSGCDINVLTDKKWLEFILEQLLSNAIKYTDLGSIKIEIEGYFLHITDTGIGIAEDDLPRIFEKGFTGYNGHMDRKATGLGLYLTSQAVKKLSHHIEVSSQIGIGTNFTLDLHKKYIEIE